MKNFFKNFYGFSSSTSLSYTPKYIFQYLDKFIIGQGDAKKAVSIALRNRWRRKKLSPEMQKEIYPKNILMIGPTGIFIFFKVGGRGRSRTVIFIVFLN